MKLCFTASSGGHLEEITCLRQITNENDSFLITEKSGEDITTAWGDRTYFLRQINRKEPFFLIHFISNRSTEKTYNEIWHCTAYCQ